MELQKLAAILGLSGVLVWMLARIPTLEDGRAEGDVYWFGGVLSEILAGGLRLVG